MLHTGVTIGVEVPSYTVNEGDGTIEVCAILVSGTLERTVTFTLSTEQNANAQGQHGQYICNNSLSINSRCSFIPTESEDYSRVVAQLFFDGDTERACTNIPIIDDTAIEVVETFGIILTTNASDVEFMPPTSIVNIIDNDRAVIGFEMERYQGGEGQMVEVCAILRNGTLERSLLVGIFTGDLSAQGLREYNYKKNKLYCYLCTEPEDYEAVSFDLTFDSERDRGCALIRLQDDDMLENTEEFQLSLVTDEEPVILEPDRAVVSILDTDGMKTYISYVFYLKLPSLKKMLELDLRERCTVVESLTRLSMLLLLF